MKNDIFEMGGLLFLAGAFLAFGFAVSFILSKKNGILNEGVLAILVSFALSYFADRKWTDIKNKITEE